MWTRTSSRIHDITPEFETSVALGPLPWASSASIDPMSLCGLNPQRSTVTLPLITLWFSVPPSVRFALFTSLTPWYRSEHVPRSLERVPHVRFVLHREPRQCELAAAGLRRRFVMLAVSPRSAITPLHSLDRSVSARR